MRIYSWRIAWSVVVAVLSLMLVSKVLARDVQGTQLAYAMRPIWAFQPASLQEARDNATQIVLATVIAVEPGPDTVIPVKGAPNGEDRVPTQHIILSISKVYRGTLAPGESVTIFQTGGTTANRSITSAFSEDDPQYRLNERFVLMLVPGPRNLLRVNAPEGRYQITETGGVMPMKTQNPNNPVTRSLQGIALAELERQLALP